jgi:hypothetical protein
LRRISHNLPQRLYSLLKNPLLGGRGAFSTAIKPLCENPAPEGWQMIAQSLL